MITHKSIGYSGRLGNQMFQYAALKSLSLKTGYEFYLPNNTSVKQDGCFDFTNNKWISYKLDLLDCFNLKCKFSNEIQPNIYQENSFNFEPEIFNIKNNTSIEGYFQSYKYFDEYRDEILKEFAFVSSILNKCKQEISKYHNPVSIHVRRGDYVNHPNYWVITPEYIQGALEYFNDDEYIFLIFSDDIEWCKQIFPEGVIFIEGNQFEDLCLMSLCKHNVICNSTFSWWGAYLNQNPNKKIIASSKWFIEPKDMNDLYLNNWTII
jgi:hypothetical protein